MSSNIHSTALIDPKAHVGSNVYVGPYCVVGSHVILEDNVHLVSHVSLDGHTHVGEGTKIYPFAVIGQPTPDLKYKGEDSRIEIGKNCSIREHVTIHPGTAVDIMKTVVGDNALLMVGVHIAHDCVLGHNVIMANLATLGGHVSVGNHVNIGGLSAVQQRVRIGDHAIIGGMSGVEKDVVPYAMVMGERAHLHGLNIIGMRRRGFSNATIQSLMQAYDTLFDRADGRTMAERTHQMSTMVDQDPALKVLCEFVGQDSQRNYCFPKGE